MTKRLLFIFFCCFLPFIAKADISNTVVADHSQVRLVVGNYSEDGTLTIGLDYALTKGWKVYWRDPGDTGYPPRLNWQGSTNVKDTSFYWPVPFRHIERFENFTSESYAYKDHVIFPIKIAVEDPSQPVTLNLDVDYGICADICIPAAAKLNISVMPGHRDMEQSERIAKFMAKVPKENGTHDLTITKLTKGTYDGTFYLQATATAEDIFHSPDIFFEAEGSAAFYNPIATVSEDGKQLQMLAPVTLLDSKEGFNSKAMTLTLSHKDKAVELNVAPDAIGKLNEASIKEQLASLQATLPPATDENAPPYTLWLILIFAFLGGLILNVMPCVLPVLSIKLLGVINQGGAQRRQITIKFLAAALGIITSFIALAVLLIALRSAGANIGWGFHFQEPLFIIGLILVVTLFVANLWGWFEVTLPGNASGTLAKASSGDSPMGHFMSGVLATVLATPCTAPFLGTAVGFAVSRSALEIIAVFGAMGVGMALPFLLFSVFPKAVSRLPKPGNWMVSVKHFMGVLLIATALWLLWVLSAQLGSTAALIMLILSAGVLLTLWLGTKIAAFGKTTIRIISVVIIAWLCFTVPVTIGQTQYTNAANNQTLWKPFDEAKIPSLVASGNIIFVDVTADWCLTCKVNKALVMERAEVVSALSQPNIIAMRADWTNKNDAIASYLKKYQRAGIPFNIVYGPGATEGIVLSEILTRSAVLDALAQAK